MTDHSARISIVTLGVLDVARSVAFYEAIGWERCESSMDEIAWFRTARPRSGCLGRARRRRQSHRANPRVIRRDHTRDQRRDERGGRRRAGRGGRGGWLAAEAPGRTCRSATAATSPTRTAIPWESLLQPGLPDRTRRADHDRLSGPGVERHDRGVRPARTTSNEWRRALGWRPATFRAPHRAAAPAIRRRRWIVTDGPDLTAGGRSAIREGAAPRR